VSEASILPDNGLQHHLRSFGLASFRPGQAEAIEQVLADRHVLLVMPTGAGKSLCYQLPATILPGVTLVISPLIALMQDQVEALRGQGVPAAALHSMLGPGAQSRVLRDLLAGELRLLYVAPERLRDYRFRRMLGRVQVSLLAVDEAHCISEWGHDFRPSYLEVHKTWDEIGRPIVLATTATATPRVQDDIVRQLRLPRAERIVTGFNRPNLTFRVAYAPTKEAKLYHLRAALPQDAEALDGTYLVYVGTRSGAEEQANLIRHVIGLPAAAYHGGMDRVQRDEAQRSFQKGEVAVVVGTSAFGMGIDKPNVRGVIHFDIPGTLEAYYQEAGRAGRDGEPAICTLIYYPKDRALQEWFIENDAPTRDELVGLYHWIVRQGGEDGRVVVDAGILSSVLGLSDVKMRVGISLLQQAGCLEKMGRDGMTLDLKAGISGELDLDALIHKIERQRAHKRHQLQEMIQYAEGSRCRRQVILDYFGDEASPEAPRCCDVCLGRAGASEEATGGTAGGEGTEVALLILDTVATLRFPIGADKLSRMLSGSRAKDIRQLGLDRHAKYGALRRFSPKAIREMINRLIQEGFLKVTGGDRPVVSLAPRGQAARQGEVPVAVTLAVRRRYVSVGDTCAATLSLLDQGLTVVQVARARGLTDQTIYRHCAQLIEQGRLSLDRIVSPGDQGLICQAADRAGRERLTPIKRLLPPEIPYGFIECVLAAERADAGAAPPVADPDDDFYRRLAEYEAQAHPLRLPAGPWDAGYTLGFHSGFDGTEKVRSSVGDLTYRFKYGGERKLAVELAGRLARLIRGKSELEGVDLILPIPSTQSAGRAYDPLSELAVALHSELGVPAPEGLMVKARATRPQKEMRSLAQKTDNVRGAFALTDSQAVRGQRVLIVDDLFDSGATLSEAARVVKRAGAEWVSVVTLTRTAGSDL